jgi:hypothetical protein
MVVTADDLDGHLVAEQRAAGSIDCAHPSFGEQGKDFISIVEDLPGGQHALIRPYRSGAPGHYGCATVTHMFAAILALLVFGAAQAAAPAQPKVACANTWQQRTTEFEDFLKNAKVEKISEIPVGVTRPQRAYLSDAGPFSSFAWKPIRPGVQSGYFESYKSEIAAYQLDKLLRLNMVPVVVERRVRNDIGAAVMWIDGVRSWESVMPLPKPATWAFQIARMKMFDDLIGNSDRNKGNLLVDGDWHVFLIDHSRAFVTDYKLPQELQNIDRQLWNAMLALDEPGLKATLGEWLDGRQIQALLKRRDAMKKKIDALVAKRGDAVFF